MTRWVCLTSVMRAELNDKVGVSYLCDEGRAQRQGGCVLPQGSVMRADLND